MAPPCRPWVNACTWIVCAPESLSDHRGRKFGKALVSTVLPKRSSAWADPILSRHPGNLVPLLLTFASFPLGPELLPGSCPARSFPLVSMDSWKCTAKAVPLDTWAANDVFRELTACSMAALAAHFRPGTGCDACLLHRSSLQSLRLSLTLHFATWNSSTTDDRAVAAA